MTESEWRKATDPKPMLAFLSGNISHRKRRLCACASWGRIHSRVWSGLNLVDGCVIGAVEFADGRISTEALREHHSWAEYYFSEAVGPRTSVGEYAAWQVPILCTVDESAWQEIEPDIYRWASVSLGDDASREEGLLGTGVLAHLQDCPTESAAQADLLREILGNPFRPVSLEPAWLTPTVVHLAQTVYADRHLPSGLFDNARLGVLADALEDAGCDSADLLGHLRGGGDHVRGCWAVDLLLGKK